MGIGPVQLVWLREASRVSEGTTDCPEDGGGFVQLAGSLNRFL